MPHYMMNCFYPEADHVDGLRKDSKPIVASDDAEAIKESQKVAIWAKPEFFQVRLVARKGDEVIYDSRKDADA